MGRLNGKVAIGTGAARGLGRSKLRSYEKFETEAQDMTGETTVAATASRRSTP